ncbi:MAG: COP23 domain-containing protein [Geitlerinemataceae cyanobacterium]
MLNRTFLKAAIFSLVAAVSAAAGAPARANYAYPDAFACQRDASGVFTTYAVKGDMEVAIIQWTSDFGSSSGYSQQDRCEMVSNRLDSTIRNRTLQYLTHGWMNGQPVICTAEDRGGSCGTLILTLPHSRAHLAASTLRSMGDAGRLASGPITQSEGGSCSDGPIADVGMASDSDSFGPRPDVGHAEPEVRTARDAGCVTEEDGTVYVDMLGVLGHVFN